MFEMPTYTTLPVSSHRELTDVHENGCDWTAHEGKVKATECGGGVSSRDVKDMHVK